jgi:RNA polymerase sigma factor (sigma-70 family)
MTAALASSDLGRLYTDHASWLRGWLHRRTDCRSLAEDLVQDTFFKIAQRGPTGGLRDPRAFLATVARCLIVDHRRRDAIERAFLDADAGLRVGDVALCPERIVAAIDELEAVVRALDTLSDRCRKAFLLARLEGIGHAEIADRIGVSKSMVKQYVAKGYACCYAAAYGQQY